MTDISKLLSSTKQTKFSNNKKSNDLHNDFLRKILGY